MAENNPFIGIDWIKVMIAPDGRLASEEGRKEILAGLDQLLARESHALAITACEAIDNFVHESRAELPKDFKKRYEELRERAYLVGIRTSLEIAQSGIGFESYKSVRDSLEYIKRYSRAIGKSIPTAALDIEERLRALESK